MCSTTVRRTSPKMRGFHFPLNLYFEHFRFPRLSGRYVPVYDALFMLCGPSLVHNHDYDSPADQTNSYQSRHTQYHYHCEG